MLMTRMLTAVGLFLVAAGAVHAAEGNLKPLVLASQGSGQMAQKAQEAKQSLTGKGFEVVGEYSPYDGATVIVVTNDALKESIR